MERSVFAVTRDIPLCVIFVKTNSPAAGCRASRQTTGQAQCKIRLMTPGVFDRSYPACFWYHKHFQTNGKPECPADKHRLDEFVVIFDKYYNNQVVIILGDRINTAGIYPVIRGWDGCAPRIEGLDTPLCGIIMYPARKPPDRKKEADGAFLWASLLSMLLPTRSYLTSASGRSHQINAPIFQTSLKTQTNQLITDQNQLTLMVFRDTINRANAVDHCESIQ